MTLRKDQSSWTWIDIFDEILTICTTFPKYMDHFGKATDIFMENRFSSFNTGHYGKGGNCENPQL